MNGARIRSDVRDFVVKTWLSGDERGFDDETDLYQTGILDSFGMLSLVGFLDETFRVTLEPTDMTPRRFRCVASIAELVMEKLDGTHPATSSSEPTRGSGGTPWSRP